MQFTCLPVFLLLSHRSLLTYKRCSDFVTNLEIISRISRVQVTLYTLRHNSWSILTQVHKCKYPNESTLNYTFHLLFRSWKNTILFLTIATYNWAAIRGQSVTICHPEKVWHYKASERLRTSLWPLFALDRVFGYILSTCFPNRISSPQLALTKTM